MRESRARLFAVDEPIRLVSLLNAPPDIGAGRYKCRLPYGRSIGPAEYSPYTPLPITNLVVVESPHFDYSYKWSDRSRFESLKSRGKKILSEARSRGGGKSWDRDIDSGCFEIIIAIAGRITDTTYSNIAFYDGERWLTPSHPLLEGTKRRELLQSGLLSESEIMIDDIESFRSVTMINAMLDPGDIELPIDSIVYDSAITG